MVNRKGDKKKEIQQSDEYICDRKLIVFEAEIDD